MTFVDPLADFRSRHALEQSYAVERRSQKLAEQTAATNDPGTRLRVWESLHALGLPRDAKHPLVEVIARDTGLTVEQVREEQRQRSTALATAAATTGARGTWDPYCTHADRALKAP